MTKKGAPRKRSDAYRYPPVSMIVNGVKYKPGQKPARVCPPRAGVRPQPQEQFWADALSHTADHIQQLLDERAQSRQGRPRPESAAKTHIRQRLAEHPELAHRPMALREFCDEKKLAGMSKDVFRNAVSAIRRETISHR